MDKIIEKQLVSKLEKRKEEEENPDENQKILLTKEQIIDKYQLANINEKMLEEDNMYVHFNLNENEINLLKNKKFNKYQLYNDLIGEYIIKDKDTDININKYTYLSRHFKDIDLKEIENLINYNKNKDSIDKENFYSIFYKYLYEYKDIRVNWNDLNIRTNLMKVYLFHIINHILKRKEEIELNDNIDKIINNTMLTNNQKINNDLFISHESDFLKEYYDKHVNIKTKINDSFTNKSFLIYNKIINEKYTKEDVNNIKINIKDQGYTSPKVLILVPYKKHAKLILEEIINIYSNGNWKNITNKKKFKDEYSEFDSNDDCFRMGISFNYFESKMKLYTPFDESDIILASPLGLKLANPNGDNKNNDIKNKKVYDFLSSIEIFLMDFSEVFVYQNLEHLTEILSYLNKQPKNNQNIVDINRIKDNYSSNYGEYLRQNIIISHFKCLDIDLSINDILNNISGEVILNGKYQNQIMKMNEYFEENYKTAKSSDHEIKYEFKILFNLKDDDYYEAKLNYFTKNIWNNLYESFEKHTIIFVSSTFDYLRLKSFFKQKSKSVCYISEDTDKKDWQRNRLFFEQGKYKFLLYNERGHFFKKINLKFAKNIFFYSLPEDPQIFFEMVQLIDPIKYNQNLEKYEIESEQNKIQKYGSVIALVSPIEEYNLEKTLGRGISKKIFKEKIEYYSY